MLRLAYFSPFLNERSGISIYSQELIKYLKNFYEVTLVANDINLINENIKSSFKVISHEEFKADDFERLIYNIGNNVQFHAKIYKMALKYPGIVILHDFFLSGLLEQLSKLGFDILGEIYYSHGLKGVAEYFFNSYEKFCIKYPINKRILDTSKAIIAHTQKSLDLSLNLYQTNDFLNLVPLLRIPKSNINKKIAKKKLDLNDKVVFGAFGIIDKHKLSFDILKAWNKGLKNDENSILIYASGTTDEKYFSLLTDFVKDNDIKNVMFTGWLDEKDHELYHEACDIAVQIRAHDTGEASGALLDCFNYENLVITNYENFDGMCIKIYDINELENAFNIAKKGDANLVKQAKDMIVKKHDPLACAKEIFTITETAYKTEKKLIIPKRRILVDITAVILYNDKTGIQRVVMQELNAMLKQSYENICPIYFDLRDGKKAYFYAGDFILKRHGILNFNLPSYEIIPQSGDVFYGLDLSIFARYSPFQSAIYEAYQNGFFSKLKEANGKIFFKVYDLLPLTHPYFFPYDAVALHQQWLEILKTIEANLIAISNKVKFDLKRYDCKNIVVKPLGSNFTSAKSKKINFKKKTFLMVGTVEERKAQKAICNVFSKLQKDANLIIVGKLGRVDEDFKKFLANKHENIKYMKHVSDKMLVSLYHSCDALIAASYDEGYGLPLIESNLPVIARDIQVFREVLKEKGIYFKDEIELISILKDFMPIQKPNSKFPSWLEVAKEILELLTNDDFKDIKKL